MNDPRCEAFERWLDSGELDPPPADRLAHASDCARCATALAFARSLDALLAQPPLERAPAGFTAAVMARLDTAPLAAPVVAPVWRDPLPLVARAALEPAVMLGLVLAGLCLWRLEALRAVALGLAAATSGALPRGLATPHPWMLALGVAPVIAVATVALCGWGAGPAPAIAPRPLPRP